MVIKVNNDIKEFNEELYVEMIENGELYDYITNLQYQIEHLDKVNCQLRKKINNDIYKSRCEKAVEYINKHKEPLHHSFDEPDCDYWIATNPQDIIDILNGRSDK